jgi:hypothetical protein
MSKLSTQAEEAIKKYNLKITDEDRKHLSKMNNDPDRQTKWVVNPLVQYCIERCTNELLANRGTTAVMSSTTDNKPVVDTKKPEPKPVDDDKNDDDDTEGTFNLFD